MALLLNASKLSNLYKGSDVSKQFSETAMIYMR